MPPTPARNISQHNVNVAALYASLTRPPRRDEVVPILTARVQELLPIPERNALQGIDSTWADKVAQIFGGLLPLCPLADVLERLEGAFREPQGVSARRLRFNFARALPDEYGSYAFTLAQVMVRAAAEASQDPDMKAAVTPAQVVAIFPQNRESAVGTATEVTATFDEAMDPTSFAPETFLLADPAGGIVPAAVTYDEPSRKATLRPTAVLVSRVTYTARLKGGLAEPAIKDDQGVPLPTDLTWSFTTASD